MLSLARTYLFYPLLERLAQRDIRSKLRKLEHEMSTPLAVRKIRQINQLYSVLRHAGANVPYYRDLFAQVGFRPEMVIEDIEEFQRLPLLTKDIIHSQQGRMLDERVDHTRLQARKTGASTGPSTFIYYDQDGLDWTAATNLLVLGWAGKKRTDPEVHFSTMYFGEEDPVLPWRERLKCFALNRSNIYCRDYTEEALDRVWSQVCAIRPVLIQGPPSTLYALALHVDTNNKNGKGIFQLYESTGETLDDKKRDLAESVFGCKVYNRYGTAEFGVIAHETSKSRALRRLLIVDSMAYLEMASVGEDLEELIVTGLRNFAMPLIRYRQGDLAHLEVDDSGQYIAQCFGRVHDRVSISGKSYPTHFIQDVLDHRIGNIEDFQIAVADNDAPELRLIVKDSSRHQYIREQIAGWWGTGISVRFITPDELVFSGWRNKLRYLVSATAAAGTNGGDSANNNGVGNT